MSYSGIVGWNAEKLTKCSSGRNENFSKGTSKYHGIVKLRIQPGLRENCTVTRQLITGSLCPSAPPSLFLSLSLLSYTFSYLSLLLIASFSFCRTTPAFSWFCYSKILASRYICLAMVPNWALVDSIWLETTTIWIEPFILIMIRKYMTFRLDNECGACTTGV